MDVELSVCVCARKCVGGFSGGWCGEVREPGEWREMNRTVCSTRMFRGQERARGSGGNGEKSGSAAKRLGRNGAQAAGLGQTEMRVPGWRIPVYVDFAGDMTQV